MNITPDNASLTLELAKSGKACAERQAGKKAREDHDAVNRELTEATDVFAASDWSNLTLQEIVDAGARIKKLATNLLALHKVEEYDRIIRECEEVLDEAHS